MHPLSDHLVVDLSSGIAGAYCTKLLADGGAEVVKAEPPDGDPLRRWSASGADIPDGDDGALSTFLSSSPPSLPAEPDAHPCVEHALALLEPADNVVGSRASRSAREPSHP